MLSLTWLHLSRMDEANRCCEVPANGATEVCENGYAGIDYAGGLRSTGACVPSSATLSHKAALVDIVTSFVRSSNLLAVLPAPALVRCWYQRLGLQRVAACCSGFSYSFCLCPWSPHLTSAAEELLGVACCRR